MLKTVKLIDLTSGREIAAGGEGKIFEHPSDKFKVIKVYHQSRKSGFSKHLLKLKNLSRAFIKPEEIYVDGKDNVLGFSMMYVNFSNYWLFNNLFNKGFCTSNSLDKAFKIKVLEHLASELKTLHTENVHIGDLNQYNLFFNKKGEILFVDVDSYQTKDNHHSGVLLDDIRDWTTSDINEKTDIYAYDVLSFWSTTYCHPYKWVVPGNKESLEQRVRDGKSILSKIPNVKIPALYEAPIGEVLKQFTEIFNSKRRYMVDFKGVHMPVSAVIPTQVTSSNDLVIRELFKNIARVNAVKDVVAVEVTSGVWDLNETKFKGVVRMVRSIACDELYPSENIHNYAYRVKDTLLMGKDIPVRTYRSPIYYYNEGYLCVIEQTADLQWNYDIQNQLGGLDNTNTPVFAKSIIKRTGLLQNFGSQIFLNVPIRNRYAMIQAHKKAKDGFYRQGFMGLEIKDRSSVIYRITDCTKLISMDLEYLPHFAVVNKDTILVPEDGSIDVYQNLQLIKRFDCNICTRTSKLYHTNSGILLLENRVLYLLNTK